VCSARFESEVRPPCCFLFSHCALERQPARRRPASSPAYAASASSEFGGDSAPMSRFPGAAITANAVTSASDSVSEPTSCPGAMSRGGSWSPSAFVAESTSSISCHTNDKSRTRPSTRCGPSAAESRTSSERTVNTWYSVKRVGTKTTGTSKSEASWSGKTTESAARLFVSLHEVSERDEPESTERTRADPKRPTAANTHACARRSMGI